MNRDVCSPTTTPTIADPQTAIRWTIYFFGRSKLFLKRCTYIHSQARARAHSFYLSSTRAFLNVNLWDHYPPTSKLAIREITIKWTRLNFLSSIFFLHNCTLLVCLFKAVRVVASRSRRVKCGNASRSQNKTCYIQIAYPLWQPVTNLIRSNEDQAR